jgi:hypothetical protein
MKKLLLSTAGTLGVLAVGAAVAVGVQALRIRGAAADLRTQVAAVQVQLDHLGGTDDLAKSLSQLDEGQTLAEVQAAAARLRDLTEAPQWRLAAKLPGLSGPLRTTRSMAADTQALTQDVLPVAVRLAQDFQDQPRSGALDLRAVTSRSAEIDAAALRLKVILDRRAQDDRTGPLGAAHRDLVERIGQLRQVYRPLAFLSELGGPMTGEAGPRRYLVVLQQPAEIRGTGGLVGGFLEVVVDHGAVTIVRDGGNGDLKGLPEDPLALGNGFATTWGVLGSQRAWFASNYSADFPSVAQVWAALYTEQFGTPLDGVVALTPEALGHLLAATGPVTLPDGTALTSANAAPTLEVTLYARFPTMASSPQRDAYQLAVLRAVTGRLLQPGGLPPVAFGALRAAVDDGSVRLMSLHPDEQATLARTAISGALPDDAGPFVAWTTNNVAGTKLDAYVQRQLSYARVPLVAGRERVVATATLTNTAPTTGLPAYVTLRPDLPAGTAYALGATKDMVATYLTQGAQVVSVTVDGKPVDFRVAEERGHPVVVVTVETQPGGGRATVVVTAEQDARPGPVRTVRQLTIRPDQVNLRATPAEDTPSGPVGQP